MAAQRSGGGQPAEVAQGPLAQALLRRREHYNQRFRMLRALRPGLDGEALAASLKQWAAPLAAALLAGEADEAQADALSEALFEICLALLQAGHAAHAGGPLEALWQRLLQRPQALAADPAGLVGRLCNAWLYLQTQPGVRCGEWLDGLQALLQQPQAVRDPAALLSAMQLLAWRCGMARFRQSALAQAAMLSPALLQIALRLPQLPQADKVAALLQRLAADPWAAVDEADPRRLCQVAEVGGFRGLGGAFIEVPEVVLVDGRLLLQDRHGPLQALYADRYGAQLSTDSSGPETASDGGWMPRLRGHALQDPTDGLVLELPGEVQSWACDGHTVVVVLRRSYRVRLYARCAAERPA